MMVTTKAVVMILVLMAPISTGMGVTEMKTTMMMVERSQ
jgi:hypothetical protein